MCSTPRSAMVPGTDDQVPLRCLGDVVCVVVHGPGPHLSSGSGTVHTPVMAIHAHGKSVVERAITLRALVGRRCVTSSVIATIQAELYNDSTTLAWNLTPCPCGV